MDITVRRIHIITGRYGKGTPDDNEIVDSIFGKERAKERFELYFHWFNLLHELGHGIADFNSDSHLHPVEEEQLVNDFAVSYWTRYGENEKLNELDKTVAYALSHLQRPADASTTYIEYAYINWGNELLHNFNNYGWFQFSCVSNSLYERKPLELILPQMGVNNLSPQPHKVLLYSLKDEEATVKIVNDAVNILRKWGAALPDTSVVFDNDPNRHMCDIIDGE